MYFDPLILVNSTHIPFLLFVSHRSQVSLRCDTDSFTILPDEKFIFSTSFTLNHLTRN